MLQPGNLPGLGLERALLLGQGQQRCGKGRARPLVWPPRPPVAGKRLLAGPIGGGLQGLAVGGGRHSARLRKVSRKELPEHGKASPPVTAR